MNKWRFCLAEAVLPAFFSMNNCDDELPLGDMAWERDDLLMHVVDSSSAPLTDV